MVPVAPETEPTGPEPTPPADRLTAEDEILTRLARASAARTGGVGAAVRDELGRTYAAGAVRLSALRLSALEAAVAQAAASGATRLEAVVLVGEADSGADPALLAEVGNPRVTRR